MTVNELAIAAKTDKQHMEPLWLDVYKLICKWANPYRAQDGSSNRYEVDDLIQSAYPALLAAVDAYPPDCPYQFTTYLFHHCQNAFREVMGLRTRKRAPQTVPLETPVADGLAIVDMIPDNSAVEAFAAAENGIYNAQLRQALNNAIQTLPSPQQGIINGIHFQGRTRTELAALQGCTYGVINAQLTQAMRALRRGKAFAYVRDFQYDVYGGRGTSWRRFRQTGTSATEAAVLRKLELEAGLAHRAGL